jgi:hypothetical protein
MMWGLWSWWWVGLGLQKRIYITKYNVNFHIYPVPTGYDVGALEEVVGAWSTENLRRL